MSNEVQNAINNTVKSAKAEAARLYGEDVVLRHEIIGDLVVVFSGKERLHMEPWITVS